MALRSMTGYGFAEGVSGGHAISVEVRSVNYKGLDIKAQLPAWAQSLEARVVRFARERIGRGRVLIRIEVTQGPSEEEGISVDLHVARARLRDLNALRTALNIETPVTLDHILTFPEIFRKPEELFDPEAMWSGISTTLGSALVGLTQERDREGQALLEDFTQRLQLVAERFSVIEEAGPVLQKRHFDRLRERLTEVLEQASAPDLFEERMFQETVLFAERCDIAEEITRAKTHLETLRDLIGKHTPDDDGPIGKKLDFYFQELIRETNTTGAKSQSATIADCVVVIRSEIDRMREQALNVE